MNLILLTALAVTFPCIEATYAIWQNEARLARYQQAWTSLNKSSQDIYYQTKATTLLPAFIDGPGYKTCWSVQLTRQNPDKKQAERLYRYWNTRYVGQPTEEVTCVPALGYNSVNALEYQFETGGDPAQDIVMFADGVSCDLFNVPWSKNKNGCELWVKGDYKDSVPSCCTFIFDLLCAMEGSYDVYNKDTCKTVVEGWANDRIYLKQTAASKSDGSRRRGDKEAVSARAIL